MYHFHSLLTASHFLFLLQGHHFRFLHRLCHFLHLRRLYHFRHNHRWHHLLQVRGLLHSYHILIHFHIRRAYLFPLFHIFHVPVRLSSCCHTLFRLRTLCFQQNFFRLRSDTHPLLSRCLFRYTLLLGHFLLFQVLHHPGLFLPRIQFGLTFLMRCSFHSLLWYRFRLLCWRYIYHFHNLLTASRFLFLLQGYHFLPFHKLCHFYHQFQKVHYCYCLPVNL